MTAAGHIFITLDMTTSNQRHILACRNIHSPYRLALRSTNLPMSYVVEYIAIDVIAFFLPANYLVCATEGRCIFHLKGNRMSLTLLLHVTFPLRRTMTKLGYDILAR